MTRWELITNDGYLEANIECIIRSRQSVLEMRKEANKFVKKYRDELLHGDRGRKGCLNPNCKVCYPYKHLRPKTPIKQQLP